MPEVSTIPASYEPKSRPPLTRAEVAARLAKAAEILFPGSKVRLAVTELPREPARLLNVKQVAERTTLSRASIYRLEREGAFPKRRPLTGKRVAWLESDVSAWVAGCGRT